MIEVNNLTRVSVNEGLLEKIAGKVLKGESAGRRKKNKDLSIALVSKAAINKLNKKYRKKNKPTDVLSFSYGNSLGRSPTGEAGEIVISPQIVKQNAKRFKSTFKKELTRVLIHGVLHFLGQDHKKSKKEAKKMEEKENYYFKQWQKTV